MRNAVELNDEVLCAYLDGELDGATRDAVERALEEDAGARVRLERMRTADARLRVALPVQSVRNGDPLIEHILTGKPLPTRRPQAMRWPIAAAMAAGIGGVIVGVVASLSVQQREPELSGLSAALVQRALERAESGKPVVDGNSSAQVTLSFRASDGRYCRLFQARTGEHSGEGVACRDEAWRVLAWDGMAGVNESFATAGASELLDHAMDQLGGGAALEAATERELIGKRWQR